MHRLILLITSLNILACSKLPDFPAVYQCGAHADIDPAGYYCVNTKTKEKLYIPFNDVRMKAAQCTSADDAKKIEKWLKAVKEIAESQCQGDNNGINYNDLRL